MEKIIEGIQSEKAAGLSKITVKSDHEKKRSITVEDGVSQLRDENAFLATKFEENFSEDQLTQIDLFLNSCGGTWAAIALADEPLDVYAKFQEMFGSEKPDEVKKQIKKLLE